MGLLGELLITLAPSPLSGFLRTGAGVGAVSLLEIINRRRGVSSISGNEANGKSTSDSAGLMVPAGSD